MKSANLLHKLGLDDSQLHTTVAKIKTLIKSIPADDVFEADADDSSVAEMTAVEPAGNAGKTVPAS